MHKYKFTISQSVFQKRSSSTLIYKYDKIQMIKECIFFMEKTATDLLQEYFGYTTFRPGQEATINHIINDHHTLAVMPTGSGKSLCFQIPALHKNVTAIIISPLISLMNDQVDALEALGIQSTYINSSLNARGHNDR